MIALFVNLFVVVMNQKEGLCIVLHLKHPKPAGVGLGVIPGPRVKRKKPVSCSSIDPPHHPLGRMRILLAVVAVQVGQWPTILWRFLLIV